MRYSFHPEALDEYSGAVSYYAAVGRPLAKSFIEAVETGIENILAYPEAWQTVEDDVRRHLISRFPFGIYYCIEGDRILIYAIMHLSRHPGYWKRRIPSP